MALDVSISSAASAYAKTAKSALGSGPSEAASESGGDDFAGMVKGAIQGSIDKLKGGETMSMKAVAGKADLQEVVAAVTAAEVTLDTVTAVRDKVITAYNEIMRMPI
jgi:flagellar hook-basal body complex protein FliE